MVNPALPWIILLSPLATSLAIVLFFLKNPKAAGALSVAGIGVSLAGSALLFVGGLQNPRGLPIEMSWAWFFQIDFGFVIDPLSVLMLLVVTGVGSCIFFYSIGYMRGDESYPRYFASLSFFAFSMIGIVLANNFLMLFVFWELVAVSSYLLIGFWFEKSEAADAGNKAFIVNRVADFGLVLGILYVWALSGAAGGERTFVFSKLSGILPQSLAQGLISPEALTVAALLVFCGVIGKSAQFPLYIWLPDAMEGPTPVSALIHAATMVAAGVYLLARAFFLVTGLETALTVIACLGAVTAFLAALLAVAQTDIKKILAYSTISQLGYMVLALGLGNSSAAMYHLTTHAFFKALLFLGAGAMIHALHTQDIRKMGGLLKTSPFVAWTFLIGTLTLCGIFPLSGFFSKDEILVLAYTHNRFLFGLGLSTAFLTAFYMARLCWIAILGPSRAHGPAHPTPLVMRWPLGILAVLSAIGGFIGIPDFLRGAHHSGVAPHGSESTLVAIASTLVALGGIGLGTRLYAKVKTKEDPLERSLGVLYTGLVKKYYLDELFTAIADFFRTLVARLLFCFDTQVVIRKGVNGAAWIADSFGSFFRKTLTGSIRHYATIFIGGVVVMVFWIVMKA